MITYQRITNGFSWLKIKRCIHYGHEIFRCDQRIRNRGNSAGTQLQLMTQHIATGGQIKIRMIGQAYWCFEVRLRVEYNPKGIVMAEKIVHFNLLVARKTAFQVAVFHNET